MISSPTRRISSRRSSTSIASTQTLGGANKTLMESVRVVTIKYHRGDDEAEDQDGVGQMGRRDQSVQLRVDHDSAEENLDHEEDGCELHRTNHGRDAEGHPVDRVGGPEEKDSGQYREQSVAVLDENP